MPTPNTILRNYRVGHGLNRRQMADQLDLNPVTYRALENGQLPVSPRMALHLEQKTAGALTRRLLVPEIFADMRMTA